MNLKSFAQEGNVTTAVYDMPGVEADLTMRYEILEGGALLEAIEGKILPGIAAIQG